MKRQIPILWLGIATIIVWVAVILLILAGCATPPRPDDGRNNDLFGAMP